jgi:hypothetical protein
MFEKWSNSLNRLESNVRDAAYSGNENSYKTDMSVIQYGKDGSNIRQYDIIGAFPTSIDAIGLDWDSQNAIETFNVTFSYDYWLPANETINNYLGQATSPVSS